MVWSIGIDVGGTFTDFYAVETDSNATALHKRPSTPHDPSEAMIEGLKEMMAANDIAAGEVTRFSHGSTVATNTLIQRKGGKVAMLTTAGFRDLVEIGRQIRPSMYDLKRDQPDALVPRQRRFEVAERMGPDGAAILELTDSEIDAAIARIKNGGGEAVAVCFLFAFVNAGHEARLAAALRARLPDLPVSVSSEVQPEFREFERFSTTVLNAYLQPSVGRYMKRLKDTVTEMLPRAQVGINQSNGGLMSIDQAERFPVRTALSGPAAGVVGAAHQGRLSDCPALMTLDMGGTSTDVCLVRDYRADMTNERDVAGFPVRLPAIDIHTIGAGGGSIAWFDRDGLLKVAPISAGSVPGPACYGNGGTEPTVSDANLILGRLGESLIGGGMSLERGLAEAAIAPLAQEMGTSLEQAADGIIKVVTANMVRALRAVSVERGYDPRDFVLMPLGGAGGLHSSGIARLMEIKKILVPLAPGILCAQGLISADLTEIFVTTRRLPIDDNWAAGPVDVVAELREKAAQWFEAGGIVGAGRQVAVQLDMRYIGQNFELAVEVPEVGPDGAIELPAAGVLRERFFAAHERNYGHADPTMPVEMVNVRLTARGTSADPPVERRAPVSGAPEPRSRRPVWFGGEEPLAAKIYDRGDFAPGHSISGPAVIEQFDATIVLHPGDEAQVDEVSNIIIEVQS